MSRSIDFSTELGEGFALPPFGLPLEFWRGVDAGGERIHPRHFLQRFEDEMLPHISSAGIACGVHSGDPVVISHAARRMAERDIAIGAHPSYPDAFRFGQQRVALQPAELEAVLLFQFGALGAIARAHGKRLSHVWCHGALGFDVSYDLQVCDVMLAAIRKYDAALPLVLMAASPGVAFARARGARVASLAFADRGYGADGRIVPRNHPAALLKEPREVGARARDIVREGVVRAVDGSVVPMPADMILLHCDTPGAGAMAEAVAASLRQEGVEIRALSS